MTADLAGCGSGATRSRPARDPLTVFGICVILMFVILARFAPWIAPYPPLEQDLANTLQGPSRVSGPTRARQIPPALQPPPRPSRGSSRRDG